MYICLGLTILDCITYGGARSCGKLGAEMGKGESGNNVTKYSHMKFSKNTHFKKLEFLKFFIHTFKEFKT